LYIPLRKYNHNFKPSSTVLIGIDGCHTKLYILSSFCTRLLNKIRKLDKAFKNWQTDIWKLYLKLNFILGFSINSGSHFALKFSFF